MIFLTITGSWTAAVTYDRREKKRIQKKWAKLVDFIAQESIDEHQMPRKLTVFIAAPPADGLMPARDHFNEYVKPILVAGALDWDAIEGRREGDVRAGLAEKIRKLRTKRGETSSEPIEEGSEDLVEGIRQRAGIREWDGPGGDIVIGRHTWKEYVRGMHEGWLGPLDPPAQPSTPEGLTVADFPVAQVEESAPQAKVVHGSDDASPIASSEETIPQEEDKPKEEEAKPKKKKQPPPFITTAEYENATLSQNCPQALGPAAVIPQAHLLGFWNFPIRMYRFLNRRKVADAIGRETAAAVLGAYRPFHRVEDEDGHPQWEQEQLLKYEEPDWHKSARDRKKDEEGKERVWLDDMVLDPRIAERMRRFMIDTDAEERARTLQPDAEQSWLSSLWPQEKKKGAWEGLTED